MAANQILSLPAVSAGISVVSSATAWNYGTAVDISASLPVGISIIGLQFQNTDTPVADITQEVLFDITVSGTTKIQIPYSLRADTLVGFFQGSAYSGGTVFLPEPFKVSGGSAVAVKVTDDVTAALTYNGVKILYTEDTPPTVALTTPTDVATGQSTTPDLIFTGTDIDSDEIRYKVQIDTVNTFDSISSFATPAKVQEKVVSDDDANPASATMDTAFVAGNMVFVQACWGTSTANIVSGVTDGAGNTYTKIQEQNEVGTGISISTWYAYNVLATTTVNVAFNDLANNCSVIIREFSGTTTTDPLDKSAKTSGSSTSPSSGDTVATTVATELVVGSMAKYVAGTNTLGTGYGNLTATGGIGSKYLIIEDKVVTSTGVQVGDFTIGTTSAWVAAVSTFKAKVLLNPIINKVSGTDAGFTGTADNTDPYASTNTSNTYTVQAGDILTASTTYYWRVAGIDPLGSNTYGAWSTTRSFTTAAAGGGTPTVSTMLMMGV